MAHEIGVVALSLLMAASPLAASTLGSKPVSAPTGTADTRYCLRIEASTGTLIETVRCWTRAEWADQGVDVDEDWAKEGVAVMEPRKPSR